MKTYDVQDILIDAPIERVMAYLADPRRSPEWAEAFKSVDGDRALLKTPQGDVEIGLDVLADEKHGTVDWRMSFPDGTIETAYSRAVPTGDRRTVFSFVLMPPVAILEQLEGGLEQQSLTLAGELRRLKELLENGA